MRGRSVSESYGEQEGSAYNGHFGCTCYHPLFCFNQFGDLERALLRNGNVASADDWRWVLEPVVGRYRPLDILRFFRGDAAFARPGVYESLTTLREKLINIGAKVVRHSRYVFFQMAEVAVPRKLFRAILERIARLRLPETVPR